jgi:hypothetical protein
MAGALLGGGAELGVGGGGAAISSRRRLGGGKQAMTRWCGEGVASATSDRRAELEGADCQRRRGKQ